MVRVDGTGERTVLEAPRPLGRRLVEAPRRRLLYLQARAERKGRPVLRRGFCGGHRQTGRRQVFVDQIEAPLWLPDGSKFVVEGHVKGEGHGLWLVSYPDGRTERLPADPHDYWGLGMTANGAQMVSVQSVRRSEILVSTDPGKGSFVKIMGGTGIAQELPWTYRGTDYRLCWTADGRIVYTSNEGGSYDLYLCRADGSGRNATHARSDQQRDRARGSPDGRYIVFVSDRYGERALPNQPDGTGLQRLTPPRPATRRPRSARHAGQQVGDLQAPGQGRDLWKVPIDGGTPVLIRGVRPALPGGWWMRHWRAASPDGKSLAFFYFTMEPEGGFSPVDLVVSSLDGRSSGGSPIATSPGWISTRRARPVEQGRDRALLHRLRRSSRPLETAPRRRAARPGRPPR